MTETISYKRQTSHTAAGDPSFGSLSTMKARIERQQLEQGDGEGRRSSNAPDLYTYEQLKLGDLVWYPEDNTSDVNASKRVVICAPLRALDGTLTHYETRLS